MLILFAQHHSVSQSTLAALLACHLGIFLLACALVLILLFYSKITP
jgi:hypothetical protein